MNGNLVKCGKCGWVHFPVTTQHAMDSVAHFNCFYELLSDEKKHEYYNNRPASLGDYMYCSYCGHTFKDFVPALPGDCPTGCTIGPIIYEKGDNNDATQPV